MGLEDRSKLFYNSNIWHVSWRFKAEKIVDVSGGGGVASGLGAGGVASGLGGNAERG